MKRLTPFLLLTLTSFLIHAQTSYLIRNVNVWDGTSDDLATNQEVLIVGSLIEQVGRAIQDAEGATVIDGNGGTLIPGLTDAHVHLTFTHSPDQLRNNVNPSYSAIISAVAAEKFIMSGFTTVRDLGGPVFGLKQAIDEGHISGPRIYPSGAFIGQTSGHSDMRNANEPHPHWMSDAMNRMEMNGWNFLADGPTEVLKATRENLKNGASQIKVMAGGGISSEFDPIHSIQYTSEELEAAVKAAADWDTYVAVHAYTPESIRRALEAGVKSIDHGQLIDEPTMKLLKEKDAWLVPQSFWSLNPLDPTRPAHILKKQRQVNTGISNEMELAKKYKVNLAFGSDALGFSSDDSGFRELRSRLRWFSPLEILRQATSENARLFELSGKINPYSDGKLGVIQEGAYADLLIYDGNPLENLEVVIDYSTNLKFIMKDGVIIKNEL